MKLFIPHCKQKMTLLSDCHVNFSASHFVTGNQKLLKALGMIATKEVGPYEHLIDLRTGDRIAPVQVKDIPKYDVVFPAGTVLMVTKVYIRNGGWFGDCINFKVIDSPCEKFKSIKSAPITMDLDDTRTLDVEMHGEGE